MYGYYNPYQQVGTQMSFPMVPARMSGANQNQQRQEQGDDRIWVQNENAAEANLVAPNSFVRLWDASRPVFYEKRAYATGRPFPLEVYEFKRISTQIGEVERKTENDILERISALNRRIEALERKEEKHVPESNADDSAVSGIPE